MKRVCKPGFNNNLLIKFACAEKNAGPLFTERLNGNEPSGATKAEEFLD
jgi:hypothetical protein